MRFLFPLLVVLAFCARAGTYYVDYASGLDANNGTGTAFAWKHCPGDPAATSAAATASLLAGDTVLFKGGVSYVLTGASGIAIKSGVTYDGNSAGTWGTGQATMTDNNGANGIQAFTSAGTVSNLVFRNFRFTQIGGGTLPPDPTHTAYAPHGIAARYGGGIGADQFVNVLIRDCYFGQLGYYQNTYPVSSDSLLGSGVGSTGCNGLTITNCEFTQIRSPVFISTGSTIGLTVANCFFHDQMEWGISSTPNSYSAVRSNVWITSCMFSNNDQYYVYYGQGGQWNAYTSSGGDQGGPHQNGIMFYGAEGNGGTIGLDRSPGDTNVFICNNYFVAPLGKPGGTTCIWLQDSASAMVFNNVFNNVMANNALAIGELATNTPCYVGVYNNTFYAYAPMVEITGSRGWSPIGWMPKASNQFIRVQNNILSTLSTGNNNAFDFDIQVSGNEAGAVKNIYLNDNLYLCDQTYQGNMVVGSWTPGTSPNAGYLMLPGLRSTYGWDSNSIAVNPLFVHVSPGNASAPGNDFHLQTNSPAIGAGVNLAFLGIPALLVDKDGNPRPAIGNWTMGAYQVGTNAPTVNQPPVVVASANPLTGPAPLAVNFSGSGSYDPEGATLTYQWTFGDGATSTSASPGHTYQAGTFTAQLTVSDGTNSSLATLTINVSAQAQPPASGANTVSPPPGAIRSAF